MGMYDGLGLFTEKYPQHTMRILLCNWKPHQRGLRYGTSKPTLPQLTKGNVPDSPELEEEKIPEI